MNAKAPWAKAGAVLVAMSTVTGLFLAQVGAAGASTPPSPLPNSGISVGAQISGSDSPGPTIECAWILPDDNLAGGGETSQYSYAQGKDIGPYVPVSYTNFTQVNGGAGYTGTGPNAPTYLGHADVTVPFADGSSQFVYGLDDNPSSYPTTVNCDAATTAGAEPTWTTASGGPGTQSSPVWTGIQVNPNAFDSPTNNYNTSGTAPRRLEVWAAVDNAAAVSFNVFYPNGKEDTALGGIQVGGSTQACSTYNTNHSNILSNMFTEAGPVSGSPVTQGTNQLSANAITNNAGTGILDRCNDNEKSLWFQAFTVSKDDPNGKYTVEVQAINTNGTSLAWLSFQVLPLFFLGVDFTSVTLTQEQGTSPPVYWASGDSIWDPSNQTSTQEPTVTNGGNSGMEVGVEFTPLVYNPPSGSPYYITNFDANLGYNANLVLPKDIQMTANTVGYISNNGSSPATGPQLVCPNDTPKLDLSAEPTVSDAPGLYTGSVSISGTSDVVMGSGEGGCLTDNGAPYILGSFGSGVPKSLTDGDVGSPTRS